MPGPKSLIAGAYRGLAIAALWLAVMALTILICSTPTWRAHPLDRVVERLERRLRDR